MSSATQAPLPADETGIRIGPLRMREGVRHSHVWTLFFVSFFGIAMMNTVGIMQTYLFNEVLKIPPNEQGGLIGSLLILQEVIVVSLVGIAGAMSDRLGRRPVFATGFILLAIGYCLYPLAGGSIEAVRWELIFFRLFIASGVACIQVMLVAVANDYPVDRTRAKMIAAVFIFNGIGIASLPKFIGGLPQRFINAGVDPLIAGKLAFWCVAATCVMLAVVLLIGLKRGAPSQVEKREPLLSTLRIGLQAGRSPRVALGYAAAFVSRADMAVISQFLTAWLVIEGRAQGLTTSEALMQATTFYVVIQAFALPWAVIWGIVLDKVDRVLGLMAGMCVAFVGYASLGMLENPLGKEMYFAAALVGAGEMAANISATSLMGKEAPDRGRGAVLGLFSLFGAAGIAVVGGVGGWLFDNWRPVGPFIYMAVSNLVLFFIAFLVYLGARRRAAAAAATAT